MLIGAMSKPTITVYPKHPELMPTTTSHAQAAEYQNNQNLADTPPTSLIHEYPARTKTRPQGWRPEKAARYVSATSEGAKSGLLYFVIYTTK